MVLIYINNTIYIYTIYEFHFQLELEGWVRIISAQFPHNVFRQVCGAPPTFQIMISRAPHVCSWSRSANHQGFVPGPHFVLPGLLVFFFARTISAQKPAGPHNR